MKGTSEVCVCAIELLLRVAIIQKMGSGRNMVESPRLPESVTNSERIGMGEFRTNYERSRASVLTRNPTGRGHPQDISLSLPSALDNPHGESGDEFPPAKIPDVQS